MNSLLPIGTVIRIRENHRKLVIVGQIKKQNCYEYVCINFPYGYYDLIDFVYVKAEDVDTIIFLGDVNY